MRVITFSRFFQSKHPRKGEPTYFVEQIWNGLNYLKLPVPKNADLPSDFMWSILPLSNYGCKFTTIRAGNRWKVGDFFSPRVWSGLPYRSKQIIIAPPIEIKKIFAFEIYGLTILLNDKPINNLVSNEVSKNDGLEYQDFKSWFNPLPFIGQIICWNEKIEY